MIFDEQTIRHEVHHVDRGDSLGGCSSRLRSELPCRADRASGPREIKV